MKLLVKMPTRGRGKQALAVLDRLIYTCANIQNTKFLLICDKDDPSTNNFGVIQQILQYQNLFKVEVAWGESYNKIHAVNRDTPGDWDVLVLTSDDMIPVEDRWDEKIRDEMDFHFPDLDGVLYFRDGYTPLNTLPIMGRKYYDRFGYIYNPIYKSFFCDNEFHIVADTLKKQVCIEEVLFKHEHPANTGKGWDTLYEQNQKYWDEDKKIFEERIMKDFEL
jgi:hypothetical protein